MIFLYNQAIKSAHIVFFQNKSNQLFFKNKHILTKKAQLLPGSGVSLERFKPLKYPTSNHINFTFISRVLKEKGIEDYIEAAKIIKDKYPNTTFHVIGPADDNYMEYLNNAQKKGLIKYHGKVFDIRPALLESHCTVFPSYYAEGMANVLLESAASARPIITTNMPGCGETVNDGSTGYIVNKKDPIDLALKLERFILMPNEEREKMGILGRKKMELEFNRDIVIKAYLKEIYEYVSPQITEKSKIRW